MELLKLRTSRPFFSSIYRKLVNQKGLFYNILSIYLLPLTLFYAGAIYLRRLFVKKRRIVGSVVSVGNITIGGTGKTPLVIYISAFYRKAGKHVIVSSSGRKTKKKTWLKIKPYDEILMLKMKLPDITITGKQPGDIISCSHGNRENVVVIDDGFHCHNIHKNMDILLIDMANPFGNGLLLPSGFLREPRRELKHADVFVLSHPYMVDAEKQKRLISYLAKFKKPIFVMDYKIESLKDGKKNISIDINSVKGKDILAFAGVGSPFNFFLLLFTLSPSKIYGVIYPDHFQYRKEDIVELEDAYIRKDAFCLITTEKDYIKIKEYEWHVPLFYIEIKPVIKGIGREDFDTLLSNIVE